MLERYRRFGSLQIGFPEDGILTITFDRPSHRNTLTEEMHRDLADIWPVAHADPNVRSILLRAEGDHFSAGGDFSIVERLIVDASLRDQIWREARDLVYNMIDCGKPIVSAMQGVAVGGGLAAGLLADISIVAKDARLLDGHVRLGVAAGDHAVLLWPLLCGLAKTKYHLLLNEPVSGVEAERIGLVSLAVDRADLDATGLSTARRLADGSAGAIRLTKLALNHWLQQAKPIFDASLAYEMMGFTGEDAIEGIASWREKRPPDFRTRTVTETDPQSGSTP